MLCWFCGKRWWVGSVCLTVVGTFVVKAAGGEGKAVVAYVVVVGGFVVVVFKIVVLGFFCYCSYCSGGDGGWHLCLCCLCGLRDCSHLIWFSGIFHCVHTGLQTTCI